MPHKVEDPPFAPHKRRGMFVIKGGELTSVIYEHFQGSIVTRSSSHMHGVATCTNPSYLINKYHLPLMIDPSCILGHISARCRVCEVLKCVNGEPGFGTESDWTSFQGSIDEQFFKCVAMCVTICACVCMCSYEYVHVRINENISAWFLSVYSDTIT